MALARATFPRPLCRELDLALLLEAELERAGRVMVVVDGRGCPHAEAFGQLGWLTDEEEWCLISAALEV